MKVFHFTNGFDTVSALSISENMVFANAYRQKNDHFLEYEWAFFCI
jgi:hypothetical protein